MTATEQTPIEHRSDHDLKEAIIAELSWTSDVSDDRIGVAVNESAVTLSGQACSFPEKQAALRAALRVAGVSAVVDDIVVQHAYGPREDADIAREATVAFDRSVVIPKGSVTATVHDHVITLSGTVTWQYQREAASRAVATLPGVRNVRNSISLTSAAVVSSAETRAQIMSALIRSARIDAQRITVTVIGSEVTLAGTASSWAERAQAEHAAWFAPGITQVHNRLTVIS